MLLKRAEVIGILHTSHTVTVTVNGYTIEADLDRISTPALTPALWCAELYAEQQQIYSMLLCML